MIKSLYVHIPFCHSICYYCDFCRCKYEQFLASRYLNTLIKEIESVDLNNLETIYIGGGTPSCLLIEQLEKLLNFLSSYSKNLKEYTIEINPESFNFEKAKLLKKYGINRVSIGVQTFDEVLLKNIGRIHSNVDVENTIKYLRKVGIDNISIDLMFGFHNQKLSEVLLDLEKAVSLDVKHISIYDLEIYPTSKFGLENYQKVDEETSYLMYSSIIDYLWQHGFNQYEISNFAKDGYQSLHNKSYWNYDNYYGAGLSACGKIDNIRYENTHNFVEYFKGDYIKEQDKLSHDDLVFEALMMNLRMNEGIDIKQFDKKFDCNILEKYHQAIEKNINLNLLELKDGRLKTTKQGIFVLNDILIDFYQ